LSLPLNNSALAPESPSISGSVLPIQRAEELLATLPGVISARIVAGASGLVEEIHILTTIEVTPKQTVRNVESALIAHLGMRVSHKKISVATSDDGQRLARTTGGPLQLQAPIHVAPAPQPNVEPNSTEPVMTGASAPTTAASPSGVSDITFPLAVQQMRRRYYFEDVEVRRSRSRGLACSVTLRRGDKTYIGDVEGLENERLRIELAARATLVAIRQAEGAERWLALEGCKVVDAFDRHFVFVAVMIRQGRDSSLTTGSAEIRESQETASVLAVLDATNRWLDR
jgi:hypothetical protein